MLLVLLKMGNFRVLLLLPCAGESVLRFPVCPQDYIGLKAKILCTVFIALQTVV